MRCEDFLQHYTDESDAAATDVDLLELEAHRAACPRCARYVRVVDEGCRLVRSLPRLEVSERFEARLDLRLLQVDEELRQLRDRGHASSVPLVTAVALAILLGAVAWSPVGRGRTASAQVQLPAIVAAPPTEVRQASRRTALPDPGLRLVPLDQREADLWAVSGNLLYEYSPLKARYAGPSFANRAFE
jgi:hypothetical protein